MSYTPCLVPTVAVSAIRVAVLVGAAVTLAPLPAAAYCRQKTCDTDDCPTDGDGCIALGDDLFYDVPCLSFAIDEGSAEPLGVSDDEMVQIVSEAFLRWREVECPEEGNPSFEVQSVGAVPASGIFFCEEEALNVSVWTLDSTWDYEPSSLGYTTSTFVVGSGEVYDADVELNLARIAGVVPPGGDVQQALLSVALHEAGHFLGLAHSNDDSAVMAVSYRDLRPRELTPDDVEGICSIYPPTGRALECSAPGVTEAGYDADACDHGMGRSVDEGSCSVRSRPSSWTGWLALAVALLGAGLRRRPSWQSNDD